jgi:hypothetical protein
MLSYERNGGRLQKFFCKETGTCIEDDTNSMEQTSFSETPSSGKEIPCVL